MQNKKSGSMPLVIFGVILIFSLIVVLFMNEGNHIKREKALKHITEAVEIDKNDTYNLEGRMVSFYGQPTLNYPLKDNAFNLLVPDIIKLKRSVSSYQWLENAHSSGEDTTYTYTLGWSEDYVNSSEFHTDIYTNPNNWVYDDKEVVTNNMQIGSYFITQEYITQLNHYEPLETLIINGNLPEGVTIIQNQFFVSLDLESSYNKPSLGDLLISYQVVRPEVITVIGENNKNQLIPYVTKNGTLAELSYGEMGKSEMQAEKLDHNQSSTWAIRIMGIIGLMLGVGMIFSPLKNTVKKIPILGNVVGFGIFLISFIIGASIGVITIALGWLFYKPLISAVLLIIIVAILYYFNKLDKEPKESKVIDLSDLNLDENIHDNNSK